MARVDSDVPPHRLAYLMALTGISKSEIAEHLSVEVSMVDRLLEKGARAVQEDVAAGRVVVPPRRTSTDAQRRNDAARLLEDPGFLTVERLEDEDEEMPPGWDWSPFSVTFNDIAAHVFDNLVEATVAVA